MIIKGRSSTMRHVSRTHRVAVHRLFDRIKLEPKTKSNMSTPKTNSLTSLTEESFSRDEWNHLVLLFNIMNFSMFSCSHFSNVLSDPIRKRSAMSSRGQEATSSEGSPTAKPKPLNSAMAESIPMNLVLHNPLGARKNPPQDLSNPVNPGHVEKEQGGDLGIWKLMRNPSHDPIEYS